MLLRKNITSAFLHTSTPSGLLILSEVDLVIRASRAAIYSAVAEEKFEGVRVIPELAVPRWAIS